MTEGVAICCVDDAVATAAAIMVRKAVRRLVVLDQKGRLAGVVSVDDLALFESERGAATPIAVAEPVQPIID